MREESRTIAVDGDGTVRVDGKVVDEARAAEIWTAFKWAVGNAIWAVAEGSAAPTAVSVEEPGSIEPRSSADLSTK